MQQQYVSQSQDQHIPLMMPPPTVTHQQTSSVVVDQSSSYRSVLPPHTPTQSPLAAELLNLQRRDSQQKVVAAVVPMTTTTEARPIVYETTSVSSYPSMVTTSVQQQLQPSPTALLGGVVASEIGGHYPTAVGAIPSGGTSTGLTAGHYAQALAVEMSSPSRSPTREASSPSMQRKVTHTREDAQRAIDEAQTQLDCGQLLEVEEVRVMVQDERAMPAAPVVLNKETVVQVPTGVEEQITKIQRVQEVLVPVTTQRVYEQGKTEIVDKGTTVRTTTRWRLPDGSLVDTEPTAAMLMPVQPRIEMTENYMPVIVAQKIKPIISEAAKQVEVDVVNYEPEIIPVDVHIAKAIPNQIAPRELVDTRYRTVGVPASQYNAILKQLNPDMPGELQGYLPYVTDYTTDRVPMERNVNFIKAPEVRDQIDNWKCPNQAHGPHYQTVTSTASVQHLSGSNMKIEPKEIEGNPLCCTLIGGARPKTQTETPAYLVAAPIEPQQVRTVVTTTKTVVDEPTHSHVSSSSSSSSHGPRDTHSARDTRSAASSRLSSSQHSSVKAHPLVVALQPQTTTSVTPLQTTTVTGRILGSGNPLLCCALMGSERPKTQQENAAQMFGHVVTEQNTTTALPLRSGSLNSSAQSNSHHSSQQRVVHPVSVEQPTEAVVIEQTQGMTTTTAPGLCCDIGLMRPKTQGTLPFSSAAPVVVGPTVEQTTVTVTETRKASHSSSSSSSSRSGTSSSSSSSGSHKQEGRAEQDRAVTTTTTITNTTVVPQQLGSMIVGSQQPLVTSYPPQFMSHTGLVGASPMNQAASAATPLALVGGVDSMLPVVGGTAVIVPRALQSAAAPSPTAMVLLGENSEARAGLSSLDTNSVHELKQQESSALRVVETSYVATDLVGGGTPVEMITTVMPVVTHTVIEKDHSLPSMALAEQVTTTTVTTTLDNQVALATEYPPPTGLIEQRWAAASPIVYGVEQPEPILVRSTADENTPTSNSGETRQIMPQVISHLAAGSPQMGPMVVEPTPPITTVTTTTTTSVVEPSGWLLSEASAPTAHVSSLLPDETREGRAVVVSSSEYVAAGTGAVMSVERMSDGKVTERVLSYAPPAISPRSPMQQAAVSQSPLMPTAELSLVAQPQQQVTTTAVTTTVIDQEAQMVVVEASSQQQQQSAVVMEMEREMVSVQSATIEQPAGIEVMEISKSPKHHKKEHRHHHSKKQVETLNSQVPLTVTGGHELITTRVISETRHAERTAVVSEDVVLMKEEVRLEPTTQVVVERYADQSPVKIIQQSVPNQLQATVQSEVITVTEELSPVVLAGNSSSSVQGVVLPGQTAATGPPRSVAAESKKRSAALCCGPPALHTEAAVALEHQTADSTTQLIPSQPVGVASAASTHQIVSTQQLVSSQQLVSTQQPPMGTVLPQAEASVVTQSLPVVIQEQPPLIQYAPATTAGELTMFDGEAQEVRLLATEGEDGRPVPVVMHGVPIQIAGVQMRSTPELPSSSASRRHHHHHREHSASKQTTSNSHTHTHSAHAAGSGHHHSSSSPNKKSTPTNSRVCC